MSSIWNVRGADRLGLLRTLLGTLLDVECRRLEKRFEEMVDEGEWDLERADGDYASNADALGDFLNQEFDVWDSPNALSTDLARQLDETQNIETLADILDDLGVDSEDVIKTLDFLIKNKGCKTIEEAKALIQKVTT